MHVPLHRRTQFVPDSDFRYEEFNNLKKINPSLKTLLAVGGWTFATGNMTLMLATKANRTQFVQSAVEYLRRRNFDGLDLDFEYPGNRGSPPGDKLRFTLLVKVSRQANRRARALADCPYACLRRDKAG